MQTKFKSGISMVVAAAAIWLAVGLGCSKKEGIRDVDDATRAEAHARRLTSAAYGAVSSGRDPTPAEMKDLEAGEKVYVDLMKYDPSAWGPYFELARIDLLQGDNKSAEENFLQFFENVREDKNATVQKADAHFLLGTALIRMGRADEAERQADEALELEPGTPTYIVFKAECLAAQNKVPEAKRLLIRVMQEFPEATAEVSVMLKKLNSAK